MTVEMDVKIEAKDLYDYLLMHAYHSSYGLILSCVGAVVVILGVVRGVPFYVFWGLLLLLCTPVTLFFGSRMQIKRNPAFRKPLHYVLDEQGITISQDGEEQHQDWADMVKAVSTGRSIIVYTSAVNATIIPKREMGDKKTDVIEIISTHMPPRKVNIKS